MSKIELPFEKIEVYNVDDKIDVQSFKSFLKEDYQKKSVIIKNKNLDKNQGGYIFNFDYNDEEDLFDIYSIKGRLVGRLNSFNELVSFINHVSGRYYSEEMWEKSQDMNYRLFNEEVQELI